jgi:hypothetical protein
MVLRSLKQHIFWHWLWVLPFSCALMACGTVQPGSQEIAFIRGNALWTIASNGSRPVQIVNSRTVLSFTWAPDHTQLVYRGLNPQAAVAASALLTPANLFVVGIDGGVPLQITPQRTEWAYTQPWWSTDGSRLLYEEQFAAGDMPPTWWIAQPDQPAGIARKAFVAGVGLPALAPDGHSVAMITARGMVAVITPAGRARVIARGAALALAPGPAAPARAIWRPGHQQVLYPVAMPDDSLTLMLVDMQGNTRPITTVSGLRGYAWSPNGRLLLLWTSAGFQVVSADGQPQLSWGMPFPAIAYWSPDSRYVLSESASSLILADLQRRHVTLLLQDGAQHIPADLEQILQAAGGSPWAPDGTAFIMVTHGGRWDGQHLPIRNAPGDGLYLVTLSEQERPSLIDWGEHYLASWTTLDTNTALVP